MGNTICTEESPDYLANLRHFKQDLLRQNQLQQQQQSSPIQDGQQPQQQTGTGGSATTPLPSSRSTTNMFTPRLHSSRTGGGDETGPNVMPNASSASALSPMESPRYVNEDVFDAFDHNIKILAVGHQSVAKHTGGGGGGNGHATTITTNPIEFTTPSPIDVASRPEDWADSCLLVVRLTRMRPGSDSLSASTSPRNVSPQPLTPRLLNWASSSNGSFTPRGTREPFSVDLDSSLYWRTAQKQSGYFGFTLYVYHGVHASPLVIATAAMKAFEMESCCIHDAQFVEYLFYNGFVKAPIDTATTPSTPSGEAQTQQQQHQQNTVGTTSWNSTASNSFCSATPPISTTNATGGITNNPQQQPLHLAEYRGNHLYRALFMNNAAVVSSSNGTSRRHSSSHPPQEVVFRLPLEKLRSPGRSPQAHNVHNNNQNPTSLTPPMSGRSGAADSNATSSARSAQHTPHQPTGEHAAGNDNANNNSPSPSRHHDPLLIDGTTAVNNNDNDDNNNSPDDPSDDFYPDSDEYDHNGLNADGLLPEEVEEQDRATRLRLCTPEVTQVLDDLFVGGEVAAQDKKQLLDKGITHIVNCGAISGLPNHFPDLFEYTALYLGDSPDENISNLFPLVLKIVDNARAHLGGKVFIHCHQGVSRSCSFVIAFVMWSQGLCYDAAYKIVRKHRTVCSPNAGFLVRLFDWQKAMSFPLGSGDSSSSITTVYRFAPYRKERAHPFIYRLVTSRKSPEEKEEPLTLDPRSCFAVIRRTSTTCQTWFWCDPTEGAVSQRVIRVAKEAASTLARYTAFPGREEAVSLKEDGVTQITYPPFPSADCVKFTVVDGKELPDELTEAIGGQVSISTSGSGFEALHDASMLSRLEEEWEALGEGSESVTPRRTDAFEAKKRRRLEYQEEAAATAKEDDEAIAMASPSISRNRTGGGDTAANDNPPSARSTAAEESSAQQQALTAVFGSEPFLVFRGPDYTESVEDIYDSEDLDAEEQYAIFIPPKGAASSSSPSHQPQVGRVYLWVGSEVAPQIEQMLHDEAAANDDDDDDDQAPSVVDHVSAGFVESVKRQLDEQQDEEEEGEGLARVVTLDAFWSVEPTVIFDGEEPDEFFDLF